LNRLSSMGRIVRSSIPGVDLDLLSEAARRAD
jgi:hypothetical protein